MLHWFAGARAQDTGDVDATGYIEPPETPAPVFAVRAFKHAIFGTPGTVPPKALRRHSNNENGKSRPNARPAMTRPKSSGDTHTLGLQEHGPPTESAPLPSPTKGILMTPGTAAARRKTVSFGAHVQDNEGKRQGKSGLPDSCPGKFPSPFVKSVERDEGKTEAADKARGRNKLTEKLEQVREESVKRNSVITKQSIGPSKETDPAPDISDHAPDHWKIMFEQYRERSERECRKLVSKQRAAKSFAREKDVQLMDTADQLRQEKKRADRLERQVADLQAELKEYQEKLRVSQAEEGIAKEEATRLKRISGLTGYRRYGDISTAALQAQELDKATRETGLRTRPSRERLSGQDSKNLTSNVISDMPSRYRNRQPSRRDQEDTWAASLAASSLIPTEPDPLPPAPSPKLDQAHAPPLKSLNTNTLSQESFSVALSMGLQPPSPQRDRRPDSPMRSPTRSHSKPTESLSITIPDSSDFLPEAENERPNVLTGTPVPIRSPVLSPAPSPLRASVPTMKENSSPALKSSRRSRQNLESKHQIQVTVVEKCDMDDVMREARLRLASIGRKVS